jgi:hypothetical protein
MTIELYTIPYIDNINIVDTILEKCKIAYEANGKEYAYDELDRQLSSEKPNQVQRSLYLYRTAMYYSKNARDISDKINEAKEIKAANPNTYNENPRYLEINQDVLDNFIMDPWKRTKWSFIDRDSSILKRSQSTQGYESISQFKLDDYNNIQYNIYDNFTTLNLKQRGGNAGIRIKRFDFEYKYSNSEYYNNAYKEAIYTTFQRVFFLTLKHNIYNEISLNDAEAIHSILGDLPNIMKLSILSNVKKYVDFEKGNEQDDSFMDSFKEFLSTLHDTLMLPFEFITYIICALVNPLYEAIIEDSEGNVGTHLFRGNNNIFPSVSSCLGPSLKRSSIDHSLSLMIPKIPLLSDEDTVLYDYLFINIANNYDINCYSFNSNKFLTNIPLINEDNIPFLDIETDRKLVSLQYVTDTENHIILWIIYSDYIISYDCTNHIWLSDIYTDSNTFHLLGFHILPLLNGPCIFSSYDANTKNLIFLDTEGNVGSYNAGTGIATPYNAQELNRPIHFNLQEYNDTQEDIDNPARIIKMKRFVISSYSRSQDEYAQTLIAYNDEIVQILEYSNEKGVEKLLEFNYYTGSPIIDVIKLEDSKKIFIAYENHKIVELSTYLYIPYIFQESTNSPVTITIMGKTYFNLEESPIYITSDNKIHVMHFLYNIKDRISTLTMPLYKFTEKNRYIKSYNEYFIERSSLPLFSNTYYTLTDYLYLSKYPIGKRT